MNAIIIMIIIAALLFGWRLYQIYLHFSDQQGNLELKFNLPIQFYVKQLFGLVVVGIFLISLDPVPAGIAIAAAAGLYINLFISIIWQSIREKSKSEKTVSAQS